MKLRGVHLRGHETLPDISLDFRNSNTVSSIVGIYGRNGTGKSLIADMIAMGWAGSVMDKRLPVALNADFCRLDFEHDNEILSIHIRGDRADASTKLAALFDSALNRHLILKYDHQRAGNLPLWTREKGGQPFGVNVVWPILSDLHKKDVRNSVVLVDDFDMGLDRTSQLALFKHLRRHYGSKNNQLILMMKEKIGKADGVWLELEGGINVIEESMQGFS